MGYIARLSSEASSIPGMREGVGDGGQRERDRDKQRDLKRLTIKLTLVQRDEKTTQ